MNEPPTTTARFHDNDVLSGKGNFINSRPGNRHFRSLVDHMKYEYVAAPKRRKADFAKMVVQEIRSMNPPGRFLIKNKHTKQWEELDEKKALIKVRQALREGAPGIERKLKEGEIEVTTSYLAQWDTAQANSSPVRSTSGETSIANDQVAYYSPLISARDNAGFPRNFPFFEEMITREEDSS